MKRHIKECHPGQVWKKTGLESHTGLFATAILCKIFKIEKSIRQLGLGIMLMEAHIVENIWLIVTLTDD